jgi:hypothetical protein
MIVLEDVRTLADVGFIALSRGLNAEASRIFEAVRIFRPDREAGYIGAALVELRRGDIEAAVKLLKPLPPSDTARAFLGLALMRLGERRDGIDMLQDVIEHAGETPAGRLASAILRERRVGAVEAFA